MRRAALASLIAAAFIASANAADGLTPVTSTTINVPVTGGNGAAQAADA